LAGLATSGLNQTINTHLPKLLTDSKGRGAASFFLQAILFTGAAIFILLAIGVLLAVGPLARFLGNDEVVRLLPMFSPVLFFLGLNNLLTAVNHGRLAIRDLAVANLVSHALMVGVAFLLLRLGFGLPGAILALAAGTVFLFALLLYSNRRFVFLRADPVNIRPFFSFALTVWLITLANMALARDVDIMFLNFFRVPAQESGFYQLSYQLGEATAFLLVGIGPIALSAMAEVQQREGVSQLGQAWRHLTHLTNLIILPVILFLGFYAPQLIIVFYSDKYLEVVWLLRVTLCFRLIYVFVGASFVSPAFFVLGKQKLALYLRLTAGLLNLVLDILMIPKWGALGAVMATGISFASVGVWEKILLTRYTKARLPLRFQARILCISAASLLPTLLVPGGYTLLGIGGKAIVFLACWVLVSLLMPPVSEEQMAICKKINKPLYSLAQYLWRKKLKLNS
jgi:O-antigen/teichoic acid export membrane protein